MQTSKTQRSFFRVQIRLKILYSNFLFIHHEAEVGIWFYIVKTAIQAKICVAKCLKCGAFCSAIQSNSYPVVFFFFFFFQVFKQVHIFIFVYISFYKLPSHQVCTQDGTKTACTIWFPTIYLNNRYSAISTRVSQVPGISVKQSSTGTSRVPLELYVLIFSHFLAVYEHVFHIFWIMLTQIFLFKNVGVSGLTIFQLALSIYHCQLYLLYFIRCAHTSKITKYQLGRGMRPSY